MNPVRVGVVGLGYWGPNLARNVAEIEDAELAWICDLDEVALNRVGRRYPGTRTTVSVDDLLNDETLDAVAIATPVSSHHPLAKSALESGKHVFVEKPLAATSVQARELASLAEAQGRILMPGHTFLYSPPVNMVRDLIHQGELGDVFFISTSRVNLGIHQPDVSVVWDLGPHDFSILRYWLDESPIAVSAVARSCVLPTTPDVAFVSLEYASGIVAHVELSWLAPSKLRRTTVVGAEKMVLYDDSSAEPVRVFDSGVSLPDPSNFGEYRLTYRTGDIVSPRVAPAEPLGLELLDFINSIRTGHLPTSDATVGVEVVRVIEAVDRALTEGHRVRLDASVANDDARRRP
jgi:predicted dehydrogenase